MGAGKAGGRGVYLKRSVLPPSLSICYVQGMAGERGGEYGEVCLNGRHITSSTAVSVLGAEFTCLGSVFPTWRVLEGPRLGTVVVKPQPNLVVTFLSLPCQVSLLWFIPPFLTLPTPRSRGHLHQHHLGGDRSLCNM